VLGDEQVDHVVDPVHLVLATGLPLLGGGVAPLQASGEDLLGLDAGQVRGDAAVRPMVNLRSTPPAVR
jgi:hypothetical protein